MSDTIYYFSSTGNSLAVARRIADRLGNCDVRSMAVKSAPGPAGGPGRRVGFVFPVYYGGMPRLVERFVRDLDILPDTCCFAFATYGALVMDTLGMLEDVLKDKGLPLSYGIGARMPGNYIVKYQAFSSKTINRLLPKAILAADAAAAEIAEGISRPAARSFKLLSRMSNQKALYHDIAGWDEAFQVSDRCIGCGLCAKVCPAGNIWMLAERPVWQHHCEHCVACVQWCPVEAIEYGNKTAGRRRYRFPGLSADAIIAGAPGRDMPEEEEQHA